MAFNLGQSTGGVSNPNAWNNNVINGYSVNYGNGGMTMGDIYTGSITNDQKSEATGGQLSQTADAKFDFTGGMGGAGAGAGAGKEAGAGSVPEMPEMPEMPEIPGTILLNLS